MPVSVVGRAPRRRLLVRLAALVLPMIGRVANIVCWPKALPHRSLGQRPCPYPDLYLKFEFACNEHIGVQFFPTSPDCNPTRFSVTFAA